MQMPLFNRSTSVGVKRRRDTNLSESTDFSYTSSESQGADGGCQLPPMTPLISQVGAGDPEAAYDDRQWEQLLSQIGGVFDAPEMGPPPLPSQMHLGDKIGQ